MTLPDFLTQDLDGEIRFSGHRIGLYSVVRRYQEGSSAEQISAEFPSLPRAEIHRVLAFYLDNRKAVDAYVADYRAELERQEAAHVPSPTELEVRRLVEEQLRGKAGNPGRIR